MSRLRAKAIIKLLIDADITQAQLARELGVSIQAVNNVIHGRDRSRRIQQHIATRLGRPYDELWGDA